MIPCVRLPIAFYPIPSMPPPPLPAGQVHYVEIDIEEDPEIAEAAGVMGTPTVHFFLDKARVAELSGVKMKKEYRGVVDKYL